MAVRRRRGARERDCVRARGGLGRPWPRAWPIALSEGFLCGRTPCGSFAPDWISGNRAAARAKALAVFGHERKIDALLDIAATAAALRADGLRRTLADLEPLLRSLPYVGPVTWGHLAQNFGVAAANPTGT